MNTHRSLMVSTVLALVTAFFSLVAPECAQSAVVSFSRTDLDNNLGPGGDLWEYQYTVSDPGAAFAENVGFSIYFPAALYRNLESPPPVVNADWDVLTLQPLPGIPASGIYDALSLSATPSLLDPFTVRFVWLGNPGTQPGSQLFEVNEFDGAGNFVSKLESGFTVPEPSSFVCIASAFVVMLAMRRRACALMLMLAFFWGGPSVFAQGAADISLVEIEKVSEQRVTRTVFEYTYRARAKNNGLVRHREVGAIITPTAPGITMVDDAVTFGTINSGISPISGDSFSFRLDRTLPFDPASLSFAFSVAPPVPPVIAGLTVPASVVRGEEFTLEFDYEDLDADIARVVFTQSHALIADEPGEIGTAVAQITGESGHATLTCKSARLPFGPVQIAVHLRDNEGLLSNTLTATVNVVGQAATGVAPGIVSFTAAAASYDVPALGYDRVPARCALQVADADGDLMLLRLRVTGPAGFETVSEIPVETFSLTGAGGSVTHPFFEFRNTHYTGNYTFTVTPFDRNGHAGVPASATIALTSFGGAVPRLRINATSLGSGEPGTEVALYGTGFSNAEGSQTTVYLGEIPCAPVSITPTEIHVLIPAGARTGALIARNPDGRRTISFENFIVPEHIALTPSADDPLEVSVGGTASFSAVVGSAREDLSVTWRVNDIAGGNATVGTISAAGVYTAPAAIPASATVQITASLVAEATVVSPDTPVTILPPPATPGAALVLASRGGTVVSEDLLTQVSIPPGALAANATITARPLAPSELPNSGLGRRTLGGVEFGPSGTVFSSPVTITIPLTVARAPGTALRCRFYIPASGTFVDEGTVATVNSSGTSAVASISHFSIIIPDEPMPAFPPVTAPTLIGISPGEVEEGARVPLRVTGTGLSGDLRVEIRRADGSLVPDMSTGTLVTSGGSAGFIIDPTIINENEPMGLPPFDSGTREYRVRLVRAHDASLFAEIPFNVRGLPEFVVAAGANPPALVNPPTMRVSRVDIGAGAHVRVASGQLRLDSLGPVRVLGTIDATGERGADGDHLTPGAASATGGAGGKGRFEDDVYSSGGGVFRFPKPENFGQHGNDPVGEGFPAPYQGMTRALDAQTRAPRGLGGIPADNAGIDLGAVIGTIAECVLTIGIACPAAVAQLAAQVDDVITIADGGLTGNPGLGAPAFSAMPRPGGGGGGGAGRFEVSIPLLGGVTVYGGSGGSGGVGGASVELRSARVISGGGGSSPMVDVRGGNGGNGSKRSGLLIEGPLGVDIYEDEDVPAFSGGGGGGGRSGTISITAAEGFFVDSEEARLRTGGGNGGRGGVVDYDMENDRIRSAYEYSPAGNGETFRATTFHRPFFPAGTFAAQVRGRAMLHVVSGLASELSHPTITVQSGAQMRTIVPVFNPATERFEADVLLYPGFNIVRETGFSSFDPLGNTPRFLVLGDDADNDGLTTDDEAALGTDPNVADTDADGVNDGSEVLAGTNPLVPPAARPDTAFAPTLAQLSGGVVNCVAVQPNGKILAAGQFFFIRGQTRNGIARFNADGSLDTTFDPGAGLPASTFEQIYCMAVQPNGKIVIGGDFLSFAGEPRGGIARLNVDGTLESTLTFNPGSGVNPAAKVLSVIAQADNKIVVAGNFTSFSGEARRGIVRLLPDGTLESTATFNPGTGPSGPFGSVGVSGATLQPDGKILLYGSLMSVNGQPRGGIARLLTDGSVEDASTFDPGSGLGFFQSIKSVSVQGDGRIIIGGDFTSVNGQPRNAIARLLGTGALESTAAFNVGTGVGGEFGTGQVLSLAVQGDGKIVLGGKFVSVDGQPRNNIARLNSDGSVESTATFDAGTGTAGAFGNGAVFGVALQGDGKILLGGEFTSVNGRKPGKLARLGTTGVPEIAPAFDPGAIIRSTNPGIVNGIAMQPDGKAIVTGQFNSVNGTPCGSITRFNPDGTVDATFTGAGSGEDSPIFCAAVQTDGKIVIGGQFNEIGGTPRYRLARLNADGSVESTATFADIIGAPGQVNCIAIQPDGKILIGGDFSAVGGQSRNGIARLNADGTLDTSFNPGAGVTFPIGPNDYAGRVYSIAVQPDVKILVGGGFTKVDGQPRNNIARLNANGGIESPATFNVGVGVSGDVNSVVLQRDGKILIAGQFSSVGGQPRGNIARLNANGVLDAGFDPTGTNSGSYIASMAVQADGRIVIGGAFNTADGHPVGNIARLLPNGVGETAGSFDPLGGADDFINAVALQADGRILLGGQFANVAGLPRGAIARLKNDPVTQNLVVLNTTYATWLRNGATPEVSDVSFELSTDGGSNWTPLGAGRLIPGGWDRTGMSLPLTGSIRARGRTNGGQGNGSAGLVGQSITFSFPGPTYVPAFMQWTQTHLDGADASELGDPDSDGIANLVEYALNLAPQTPDAAPFAATRFKYADGERLRLFLQRDPARNDVTIEVEAADNIAGPWEVIARSERGAPFTGDGYVGGDSAASGVKTVEIRDTVNIADVPVRFLRVRIQR